MTKADLHVHSKYSAHPSEWFLKRIGTHESYTEPEAIYRSAKQRGMDFIVITDHNQMAGSLYLQRLHPDDVFTGVEVTTYFPEDNCKIHVLVWGLTEEQFAVINTIRRDIYQLRYFIKEENLAHAVAHATYAINQKLTITHVEKLFLLFDFFEGVNGCRTGQSNDVLTYALNELTPMTIDDLYTKHKLEPFSDTPWHKGITGGSDDHSGLFIGKAYTKVRSKVTTPQDFLDTLKRKESLPGGSSNDFRGFAVSLYKIAYEFSKTRSSAVPSTLINTITQMLFDKKRSGFRNRLKLKKMQFYASPEKKNLVNLLARLMKDIDEIKNETIEKKIDNIYRHAALITDELLISGIKNIAGNIAEGNIVALIQNLSSIIPPAFISFPFFTTINVLHESRDLINRIERTFNPLTWPKPKKYLWFTDTLTDLNGVSETIRKVGELCFQKHIDCTIVTSLPEKEMADVSVPNVLNLPLIYEYRASFFKTYTLRFASLLQSLQKIYAHYPDEILVSTPGPIGLTGLLCARLLRIPCRGIYHTDFSEYARKIINDEVIARVVKEYIRWFYSLCSTIYVPTDEYLSILENRGYARSKMKVFKRGIDKAVFSPKSKAGDYFEKKLGIAGGISLLYAGRISKEKNIDMLLSIYKAIEEKYGDTNLLLCGNGPDFEEYRERCKANPRIHFLGRLPRTELPNVYTGADIFLFPSVTDTFGMVVLEAQACGLPAIVSDRGGPQEIVVDNITGHVARSDDITDWINKASLIIDTIQQRPDKYLEMRYQTCEMVRSIYDWNNLLRDLFNYNETIHVSRGYKKPKYKESKEVCF